MGRALGVWVACALAVWVAGALAQAPVWNGDRDTAGEWVRAAYPEVGREMQAIASELQGIVDAMHAARDAGECRMCNNLAGRVNGGRTFVEGFYPKIASHSRQGTRGQEGHDAFVREQLGVWNAALRMPMQMLPRSDFADAPATVAKLEALTARVERLLPKIRVAIDDV